MVKNAVGQATNAGERVRIAAHFRYQSAACARRGSPLYGDLLRRAAEDLECGGATWRVLAGHRDDPGPSALALRLMGAVNRLALDGTEPELGDAYASTSQGPAQIWPLFRAVLERRRGLLGRLVKLPVQTNEVARCAALLPGFLTVAAESGMPLRLLEVGASAGLSLRWDHYRYRGDGFSWGPEDSPVQIKFEYRGEAGFPAAAATEIAERRGCDRAPIDPLTAAGELTLLSYIWPDQPARVVRMRAAIGVAARVPLVVDRDSAASWVGRELSATTPGLATVIYHSFVAQYMGASERRAFRRNLAEAGDRASASAPLAWLRMEPGGDLADVKLTTWPGGRERHLARADAHGSCLELRPSE